MDHRPIIDDPLGKHQPDVIEQHQRRAVRSLLMTFSYFIPVIALALYQRSGLVPLTGSVIALWVFVWALWLPFQGGRTRLVAHWLIAGLLITTTLAIYHEGTVRSAAVLAMMAGVIMAGTFLPRLSMAAVGLYCIVVLGVFNWMEQQGMLGSHLLPVSWVVWVIQSGVVTAVLVSLFYGRHQLIEAYHSQAQSLHKAQAAKDELRASDYRFKSLFRNNPAACMVQSVEARTVIDANEAFLKLTGYARDELQGHEPPALWANADEHKAFRAQLKANGSVQNMRARSMRKDGTAFDVEISAEVLIEGFERLIIVMVLDVSAEVASRDELEKSRERFSTAFSFSPLGTVIRRLRDGLYLEANTANEQVLGYSSRELVGHTSRELDVWLTEDEHQAYNRELNEHGQVLAYAARQRNKWGEPTDVHIWSRRIDLDSEACELVYSVNVTEQKRREAMLMNVARGVSSKTGEAFFLSLADHLAQGIGAEGILIGEVGRAGQLDTLALMQDGDLQPNRSMPMSHTALSSIVAQEDLVVIDGPARQMVLSVPTSHPESLQTLAGVALRDPDGSAIGLLAVVWREQREPQAEVRALLTIFASRCNAELVRLRRDREIRRLQSTLERRVAARTQQLEYLNRELESFSYSVSHDLKSPLRSMDGFTHMLREQMASRLTAEDEDLIARVQGAIARMNSLITDLLALARVSQGSLQRMDVNLSEIAEDVIRRERHTDPGREVEVRVAPNLMANCDARMAHIVLENLLGNAWKYSRQRKPAVIELDMDTTFSGHGGAPCFFIRDNGAGFDMSRSDRLFKPFTRLHAATEFEGSGIGLATVRRIIERHGGHIEGSAQPGEGATFRFSFGSGSTV
jgi:PAS domain S-box-containing protein